MRQGTTQRIEAQHAPAARRRRVLPTALALIGAVGVVLSGAGCEAPVVIVERSVPAPARVGIGVLRVEVVGDSLVRQSTPDIETALVGAGLDSSISSQPGMDITTPFIRGSIERVAGGPADIVVLATASNDIVWSSLAAETFGQEAAQKAYRGNLSAALGALGTRCVVVVNGRENVAPLYRPGQAPILNENLRAETAGRNNVVVVDWAGISRAHGDDWFVEDQLHFGHDAQTASGTKPGARAYAVAVRSGVQTCRARLSPV